MLTVRVFAFKYCIDNHKHVMMFLKKVKNPHNNIDIT